MSTLTVDFIISLDGYGAAEGWPAYWGLEGPEYLAWLQEDNKDEAVHLMGANTYTLMASFAGQSDAPESKALDNSRKVVFSSSLTEPLSWSHSEIVTQDAVEFVRELKKSETRQLRTLGSASLCRSLITAGVVDRFRIVVFPVITGKAGRERIFDGYPDATLELVEARTFDGGIQLLEYVPTVVDGPPKVAD